jgi:hypothetical protein
MSLVLVSYNEVLIFMTVSPTVSRELLLGSRTITNVLSWKEFLEAKTVMFSKKDVALVLPVELLHENAVTLMNSQ